MAICILRSQNNEIPLNLIFLAVSSQIFQIHALKFQYRQATWGIFLLLFVTEQNIA